MTDNWIVNWLKRNKEYNPAQPRYPAGDSRGGEWMPVGGTTARGPISYKQSDLNSFVKARDATLDPAYSALVTQYSADDYREMDAKTYLSETGKSGYAIKPDGDIISVFSAKGSGEGRRALLNAVCHGGKKLDCFDGFLPGFYSQFGFEEYDRWTWDDQYMPSGWNKTKFDSPDVVLMRFERD